MEGSFQKWYTKAGFVLFLFLLFVVTVIADNNQRKFEQGGGTFGDGNQQLETLVAL